ncbi:unnamed protein product [marine sediment metagenome]|uniref:Transcription regulator TrmB N-terminal domain-containing protein n=1 Tax=marine sediment metagenome TaxID=412755 RepID=X1B4W3_9ZZZZ
MLKEFTKEIFTQYGFTEEYIKVYLVYVRVPRATMSEVFYSFEEGEQMEWERIGEITDSLIEKGFLKKIEGIVDRYVPLQPFFSLFTHESEIFRNEISKLKEGILTDQSSRFEKHEIIQNKSIGEVEDAVNSQIKEFFIDSDS